MLRKQGRLYWYVSSNQKYKEGVSLLLNGVGSKAKNDTEKADLLDAAFALILTGEISPKSLWQEAVAKQMANH